MNDLNEKEWFIGAGNMATALISGLINSNFEPQKLLPPHLRSNISKNYQRL